MTTRIFILALALAGFAARAHAQTVSGTIPRRESPSTWSRPNAQASCPGSTTTRTFNRAFFQLSTAGTYTVTATRSDGGFIAIDLYQGGLYGTTGTDVCVNRWDGLIVTGMGSASRTFSCSSMCNLNFFEVVLSGANSTDTGPVSLTVSGPAVTFSCSGSASLTPNSQTGIPSSGGSYSTTFVPASHLGCSQAWTSSSVASWVTGVPASGTGETTINYTVAANTGAARTDTMNIGGRSMSLGQDAAAVCSYAFNPTSANITAAGGTNDFSMVTTAGCAWTTSESSSWLSSVTASGTGNGTISYTASANTGPARSDTITSQSQTFTVNQANGCSVSLTPDTVSPSAAGGATTFSLATTAGCPWTLSSNAGFVTGFATSGTGPATIDYTVAANSGIARSATLTATATDTGATDTFVVNQASGCTAGVSPSTINATGSAQMPTVALTMSNASCPWTASSASGFITPSPASGTGSATVTLALPSNTGAARSGTATVGGQTVTVNQASACTIDVSAATADVGSASGSGSFTVTAPTGCAWSVGSSAGFLTGFATSGSGTDTVNYNYAGNTALSRSGTLTATLTSTGATDTHVVTQANGCTAGVNTNTINANGTAHSENVTLTLSAPTCPFTTSSGDSWITPSPTSGTGSDTIALALSVNSGAARSGSATIGGQTVTVNQASVCTVSVDPTANVGPAAGSGSFDITTQAGCAWSVGSSAGFLSGFTASGTGPATIDYDVAGNTSILRTGVLTATLTATGATAAHTVEQASGCTASLSTDSATPSEASGSDDFELTLSDSACPWTASSDAGWLTLPTASGTGNATIAFDFEANIGPERVGTITLLGETFEVTQASGCVVSATASQAVAAAGGTGSVTVDTEPGCTWTATTTTPWLTNVTSSGSGDGAISFDYGVNVGSDRSGAIEIASSTTASTASHAIEQANGCVAMLAASSETFGAGAASSSVALTLSGSDCTWNASSSESWLTLDTTSGTNSATVGFEVDDNVSVSRSATLTIAGQTFTVEQDSGCAIQLTPTTETAGAAAGTLSFDLATDAACGWTATEGLAWLSGVAASGTGPATITLDLDANVGPDRQGDVVFTATDTSATATYTAVQSDGCTAMLSATSLAAGAAAESGSVVLTLSSQTCTWTASASGFITLTNDAGTGDATIAFDVAANDGSARTGTITIAGEDFTVTQADGCSVTLSPETEIASTESGTVTFDVQTAADCEWTATAALDWITSYTEDGTGPGQITVELEANEGPERVELIEVEVSSGAAASFTLTQSSGCTISLPVTSAGAAEGGGNSSFAVLTGDGCEYTVSSDSDWLAPSVSDDGVEYTVASSTGAERSAVLTVTSTTTASSASFTVTQSSGCTVMLTPGNVRVGAAATTTQFEVVTGDGCEIAATTGSTFVSVELEDETVRATVAENPGDERMALITVTAGESSGTFALVQDAAEEPVDGDAGPAADAGTITDAGTMTDAGPAADGGETADAGTARDAGTSPADAGERDVDAGYTYEDLVVGGGCACNVASRRTDLSSGLGALLLGLVLVVRAQRRRKR